MTFENVMIAALVTQHIAPLGLMVLLHAVGAAEAEEDRKSGEKRRKPHPPATVARGFASLTPRESEINNRRPGLHAGG